MGMWDFADHHPIAFVFACFALSGFLTSFITGLLRGFRK